MAFSASSSIASGSSSLRSWVWKTKASTPSIAAMKLRRPALKVQYIQAGGRPITAYRSGERKCIAIIRPPMKSRRMPVSPVQPMPSARRTPLRAPSQPTSHCARTGSPPGSSWSITPSSACSKPASRQP